MKVESDSPTSRRSLGSRDRSSGVLAGLVLQVRDLVDLTRRSAFGSEGLARRERRLAVDEHEKMGENAVRTPRQKCDDMGAQAEHGA